MSATKVAPAPQQASMPHAVRALTDDPPIEAQAVRGVINGLGLSAVIWLIIALVVIAVW